MKTINVGASGSGHVRACFSRRHRGYVVAVDLLRSHFRVCNRLTAERHNAAVYARLAEDFGGYLVTDKNPSGMAGGVLV